jgi:hypothetical protein
MAYAKRPARRNYRTTRSGMPARKTITKNRKTTKQTFNKRVLAVVNRNTETKMKIVNIFNESVIHGFGLKTTAGITPTVPGATNTNILQTMDLQQGMNQEGRIGNEVGNCKLRLRGYIHSLLYSDTTNTSYLPYEVHMLVYKKKKEITNDFSNIKSLPNNSVGEIDHTIINTVYPFNTDSYIIKKHRVFKMRPLLSNAFTNEGHYNSQFSNAPAFRRFQVDINISNKLMYADKLNIPSNDWVGVLFYVINGDGGELYNGSNWQQRCKVSMDAVLTYKDA